MKISIIIPCYNEEKTIEKILNKVLSLNLDKEIIVVDDGSTDRSFEILKKLEKENNFKLVLHKTNLGKGSAIKSALKFVSGDYVITQDADLELDPNDISKILDCAIKNQADAVYGFRLRGDMQSSFYWGGYFLTLFTNILYGIKISDVTMCYKLVKTDIIKNFPLKCKRFEYCPELTAFLAKRKIKIYEVPVNYTPRSLQDGKKLKRRDGFYMLWTLIKNRF
jgi:glycosyltransferase involved in cell wall biosynthesis